MPDDPNMMVRVRSERERTMQRRVSRIRLNDTRDSE